jgi:hypothetical protein
MEQPGPVRSRCRKSCSISTGRARQGSDDPRFNDYYGSIQSIVTSSAQSDSGLFETNLKDERYLPFEGAGAAASVWQLTLPSDASQFIEVICDRRFSADDVGSSRCHILYIDVDMVVE